MGLRVPTVDRFLCCCELQTGVLLVGVLSLVSSGKSKKNYHDSNRSLLLLEASKCLLRNLFKNKLINMVFGKIWKLKTGVLLVGVLSLVSSQCLMRDQSGNSRQNLCEHMLIFFWPMSSSANTTALIYCRYIVNIYNRYIVNVIFSLEHCVAAWEHPLPSPSLLWVRTICHLQLYLLFLDPTILEYAPGEFCVGIFTLGEEAAY